MTFNSRQQGQAAHLKVILLFVQDFQYFRNGCEVIPEAADSQCG